MKYTINQKEGRELNENIALIRATAFKEHNFGESFMRISKT